jgi:hypothetical protein
VTDPRPYKEWRSDPTKRWRDAFHNFGHILLTHARNGAVQDVAPEHRDVATKAATDALYNVMMILEGIVGPEIGEEHTLEFALVARIRERTNQSVVVEQFELAPEGEEPACMGFHFWAEGDFRV